MEEDSLGSDMHLSIEYRSDGRWWSFASKVHLERNYFIFERLAGVRGKIANAIAPPRGFPPDASTDTQDENFLWIDYGNGELSSEDPSCTPQRAAEWVASGKSKYFETINKIAMAVDLTGKKEPELVDVQKHKRVSRPDWHTHSWLSTDEFESAIKLTGQGDSPLYWVCIAAMRSLENDGHEVRAVFWFDD